MGCKMIVTFPEDDYSNFLNFIQNRMAHNEQLALQK